MIKNSGLRNSAIDQNIDFSQREGLFSNARGSELQHRERGNDLRSRREGGCVDQTSPNALDELFTDSGASGEDMSRSDEGELSIQQPLVKLQSKL